eukprot:8869717-Prorocentrum_lima.AAC.1
MPAVARRAQLLVCSLNPEPGSDAVSPHCHRSSSMPEVACRPAGSEETHRRPLPPRDLCAGW